MADKLITVGIIWAAVLVAYLILGFTMDMHNQIISDTLASYNATANMTNFPGMYDATASAPVWLWFIPGPVGMVATVVVLKKR